MAKKPVFRNGKPLWIRRNGILKPAWSDDPCDEECCEECPPCEAECTTGWASGSYTVDDCPPTELTLTDTSSPPAGYCYSSSSWTIGSDTYTSTNREFTLSAVPTGCVEVDLTSHATCCDPEQCGSCSDTTNYYIEIDGCCCYGVEECPSGAISWPPYILIKVFEAEFHGPANACGALWESVGNAIADTWVVPHVGGVNYELATTHIPPSGCSCDSGWVRGFSAQLGCDGTMSNAAAGILPLFGCGIGCLVNLCCIHSLGSPVCHNTRTDETRTDSCSSGGYSGELTGLEVTW